MSVTAKHWYRFKYLKSQEWENIRLEVLVQRKCKCYVCGSEDRSNDVHHAFYVDRERQRTYRKNLFVLCRRCHSRIHEIYKPGSESTRECWDLFKAAAEQVKREIGEPTAVSPFRPKPQSRNLRKLWREMIAVEYRDACAFLGRPQHEEFNPRNLSSLAFDNRTTEG